MSIVSIVADDPMSPFVQLVNNSPLDGKNVPVSINPEGKTWVSVRVPSNTYLNSAVSQIVYRQPLIPNPGFLSRYVKGLKPDAGLTPDDLAVLNGLFNLVLVGLPVIGRSTVTSMGDGVANWATLVHASSVDPAIMHTTFGVGGLGGRYLFSRDEEGLIVHYMEPDRG